MLKVAIILLVAAVTPLLAEVSEQDARFAKLPAGTLVSPARVIEGMAFGLGRTNPLGYAENRTNSESPDFDSAMRIVTRKRAEHPWAFQVSAKTTAAVKRGDVMLAVFWARAAGASEEAESAFVFEHGDKPYEKSVSFRFDCEREWTRFFVPFLAARDEPAGDAALRFHAGYGPQVIEIGGLEVFNYEHRVRFGDLPYTPLTYKGRSADAEWRDEAAKRITRQRKAPMFITVRNSKGKLMPWTTIRVRQTKHAFDFGSAVAAEPLFGQTLDHDKYREVIVKSFNKATLENDLKWPQWESNRQRALDAVSWLQAAGIGVRGHTLLWPSWKYLPADIAKLQSKPDEMRKRILDHITEVVSATKGQVAEWDVVNEPVTNTDIQQVLGPGILIDAYKAAHEADPKARLFINDHSILSNAGADTEHQDAYFKLIKTLLSAKAPLHGIGMQGHFDDMLTPPTKVWEILDRFADLNLPVKITEFDINVWDERAMADYTRDFMTAVFAHKSTTGLMIWGFWERAHWIPNAAHWTSDWTQRVTGKVWQDLVFKQWWTDVRVETNGKGVAKVSGFLGDYVIEFGSGENKVSVPLKLTNKGEWITIRSK